MKSGDPLGRCLNRKAKIDELHVRRALCPLRRNSDGLERRCV